MDAINFFFSSAPKHGGTKQQKASASQNSYPLDTSAVANSNGFCLVAKVTAEGVGAHYQETHLSTGFGRQWGWL